MREGPRVLCVCDWLVKYTAGLATGLAEAGADAGLLTRSHDHEFGGEPGAKEAHLDAVLDPRVRRLELHGRPRELAALPGAWAVAGAVRTLRPDVVHLQQSVVSDPRLVLVARPRRGRYALTIHDVTTHPGDPSESGWRRRLEDALIRRAGVTFVHAERLIEPLRARVADARVAVVPHGVDAPAPLPWPARPRLLFFGRMSYYKGLDVLLDALDEVWRTLPDLELDVAGKGRLPEHSGLEDPRVHLRREHVPEADVPGLFRQATCVVLPYREASQSGVGSLAKHFGRGMVVTDVGGLPELVADGSGLVVAAEDPAALAAAILRVVREPGLAERLGGAGSQGQREASWRHVGELTLAAYADAGLLPAGSGAPASTASSSSE